MTCLFALLGLLVATSFVEGRIMRGNPVKLKILVDLSASMYPGYEPGNRESGNAQPKRFVNEYPAFRKFFADFIDCLKDDELKCSELSITGFVTQSLSPAVHTDVNLWGPGPVAAFNLDSAMAKWKHCGLKTDLKYNLSRLTQNFEGIVFLITDNIVETEQGDPENMMRDFFGLFKQEGGAPQFRAAHVYKHVVRDPNGKELNLAIYGFVISPEALDDETACFLDEKFTYKVDEGTGTVNDSPLMKLFNGLHVKLRDMKIRPVTLDVQFLTQHTGNTKFTSGAPVRLAFKVTVVNNTIYNITGGALRITPTGQIRPANVIVQKEYGLKPIPASLLKCKEEIIPDIPPRGTVTLPREVEMKAAGLPLAVSGFWNYLKEAVSGLEVAYRGTASIVATRLEMELSEESFEKLSGIYKGSLLKDVFKNNEHLSIQTQPVTCPLKFVLRSSPTKGLVVLAVLLVLFIPLVILAIVLAKPLKYKLKIDQKESVTPLRLRRMGSCPITFQNKEIGVLRRGMGSNASFHPDDRTAGLSFRPKAAGEYWFTMGEETHTLSIHATGKGSVENGGKSNPGIVTPGGDRPGTGGASGGGYETPKATSTRFK